MKEPKLKNVKVSEGLHQKLKLAALRSGMSVQDLTERAIRKILRSKAA